MWHGPEGAEASVPSGPRTFTAGGTGVSVRGGRPGVPPARSGYPVVVAVGDVVAVGVGVGATVVTFSVGEAPDSA